MHHITFIDVHFPTKGSDFLKFSVPDAPVRLFCKLTEPTIISVQWSAPPTSPFIYPVQEYILQNNTGKILDRIM